MHHAAAHVRLLENVELSDLRHSVQVAIDYSVAITSLLYAKYATEEPASYPTQNPSHDDSSKLLIVHLVRRYHAADGLHRVEAV